MFWAISSFDEPNSILTGYTAGVPTSISHNAELGAKVLQSIDADSIGAAVSDCLLFLHSCVTAKPACSYMKINYAKRATPMTGLATQLDAIRSPIEAPNLMVFEIISCSDLHIP